ncbi:hypothetical protein D3C77_71870 [compost metagenome]
MGEHIVCVIKLLADCRNGIKRPKTQPCPWMQGNQLQSSLKNFQPIGRTTLHYQGVQQGKCQQGSPEGGCGDHITPSIPAPHGHGDQRNQTPKSGTTALGQDQKCSQTRQGQRPDHLEPSLPWRPVKHPDDGGRNYIGPQNRMRQLTNSVQPENPRLALHTVKLNNGIERSNTEPDTAPLHQPDKSDFSPSSKQREKQ